VREVATLSYNEAYGVAVDSSGNVLVMGYRANASVDAFVAKYDSGGNQVWVKGLETGATDFGGGDVAVDSGGNAYVVASSYLRGVVIAKFLP
jgi:hypothetical protein